MRTEFEMESGKYAGTHVEEHLVNLLQGSVFSLGKVEVCPHGADYHAAAKDEAHLCPNVRILGTDQVGATASDKHRSRPVERGSYRNGFRAQPVGWDLGNDCQRDRTPGRAIGEVIDTDERHKAFGGSWTFRFGNADDGKEEHAETAHEEPYQE